VALNRELIGKKSAPTAFTYTWKDTVLYALGVGCKADDLDYLYVERGPRVLPTFGGVPSFASMLSVVSQLEVNLAMVVHGEQKIVLHREIPSSGTLSTISEVTGIYDKGQGALVVVEAKTTDSAGKPLFDNVFSIFVRGEGGFGGARGPEVPKAGPPADRKPDFEVTHTTSPEQAILYCLSGDLNPLHIDPDFANMAGFDRPILHGLCTYGHAGLAILKSACDGQVGRLKSFAARFSGVVLPGDTLTTHGWKINGGICVITTTTADGKVVLSNGIAEVG